MLNISGIDSLRYIAATDEDWVIPAMATWCDVLDADLPPQFEETIEIITRIADLKDEVRRRELGEAFEDHDIGRSNSCSNLAMPSAT